MGKLCIITTIVFISTSGIQAQIGRVGINTTSPAAMFHVRDSNVVFTGPQNFAIEFGDPPVSGEGVRMMWYPNRGALRAGYVTGNQWDKGYIGTVSFATGVNTVASGSASVACGYGTDAIGSSCIAMGEATRASGFASVALGYSTIASGSTSFASGYNTKASGHYSSVFGYYGIANSAYSFVVGRFNDTTASSNFDWIPTDPLFAVGNGTSINTRSNALTILKNGRIGIKTVAPVTQLHITGGDDASYSTNSGYIVLGGTTGDNVVFDENEILARNNGNSSILYLQKEGGNVGLCEAGGKVGIGNSDPAVKLHISGGSDASYSSTSGFLVLGSTSGTNIVYDENEILARSNGAPSTLHLQISGGDVSMCEGGGDTGIGVPNPLHKLHVAGNGFFTGTVTASCGVLSCSDMRYKKNIAPVTNALQSILGLQGIYYDWNEDTFKEFTFDNRRQIGLSAQELETVYPEMVYTNAEGYKTVDYSRLGPILIEAIKEQQSIITSQEERLAALEKEIQLLKQAYQK